MNYKFSSLKQILDLFGNNQVIGATEISNILGKSRAIVHKYLKELVKQKKIKKVGKGPYTKYKLTQKIIDYDGINNIEIKSNLEYIPNYKTSKLLDEIFYKFTPEGKLLKGFNGIVEWCSLRNFDLEEKVKNYISIYKHIEELQDSCGLLSNKKSFLKQFKYVYLDEIFYADQYNYMEFGRGKLAEMTFYAKQSQNKDLINESISEIILKLECLIKNNNFNAIAITPWSIDRKNQLLDILKNKLKYLGIPFVNVIKYYPNNISIPQKSLKTSVQRIQNARNTIFVNDTNANKYKNVLLIDDFVGSGATLNETAKKLKEEGIKKVYGFAFVGNLDLSYEVINEI